MATLVKGILNPVMQQEQLVFMDIFGKRFDVYLDLSAGPTRADKIASVLATLTATEESITAYAAVNGHDLTADLATGAADLAALQASLG